MASNNKNNSTGGGSGGSGDEDSLISDNDLQEDLYSMLNVPKDVRIKSLFINPHSWQTSLPSVWFDKRNRVYS